MSVEVTRPSYRTEVITTKSKVVVVTDDPTREVIEVHDPGVAGPPNVLSIGTVETGNTPDVTITGTAPAQTLNFVIPVGGTYIHNQGVASTTWTITHNLGFYPSVTVSDSADTIIEGQVDYPSVNTVVLTFSSAFAGKAYLS